MSKRNIWKTNEVVHFLSLMKEKKILGLMDGKRLRISEIFKTLEKQMLDAGFPRDASAMQMKFKNLKRDYYKDQRANTVSGSGRSEFEYYNEMDELLGDRPASQMEGIESARDCSNEEVIECHVSPTGLLTVANVEESEYSEIPVVLRPESSSEGGLAFEESDSYSLEGVPGSSGRKSRSKELSDSLEGVPGPSRRKATSPTSEKSTPKTSRKSTTYQKTLDKFIAIQTEMKDTFVKIASDMSSEQDHLLMTEMMDRQEDMLKRSTDALVSAIKSFSRKGKKRRKAESSSCSSSD